jgi:hypothetical protein
MEIDWVKRKALGEQFVDGEKEHIWENLCAQLGSATESYVLHYGGKASAEADTYHHYRVSVCGVPPFVDAVVDVHFVPPEIRVSCRRGICKTATYYLSPNRDAPFRTNERDRLTVDQVSEAILRPVFFPAENRGVNQRIVSPCTSNAS